MAIAGATRRARRVPAATVMTSVLILAACGDGEGAGATQAAAAEQPTAEQSFARVINVELVTIAGSAFSDEVNVTGTVAANRDVIVSAEESGVIREVYLDRGRRVRQGQEIAKIDDAVLAAQVEQARAQAELGQQTWERRKRLYEEDHVGSELAYLESKAAARQSQAGLDVLEERLARTIIRAPISGILEDRMVEIGTMVSPGTPVARVIDLNPVKIEGGVPERYALDIARGAQARVTFDVLGGRTFTSQVTFVGSAVDPGSRTFPVEITLPNRDEQIKPEMVASIALVTDTLPDAVVVPQEALVRVEDGYVAFVVEQAGGQAVARVRHVELGASQRNQVVIRSGLAVGDQLIVVGQQQVADGDRVRVVTQQLSSGSS